MVVAFLGILSLSLMTIFIISKMKNFPPIHAVTFTFTKAFLNCVCFAFILKTFYLFYWTTWMRMYHAVWFCSTLETAEAMMIFNKFDEMAKLLNTWVFYTRVVFTWALLRHDLKIIPLCTIYKPPNTIIAKHNPNPGQSILLLNFSYRKSLRNNQNSAPYESLLVWQ